MHVVVPTCNRYLPILEGYSILFNKYWSSTQEVTVICDEEPTFKLPSNFNIVPIKLGRNYKSAWSDYLIEYFKIAKLDDDDCFLLAMDDHYLIEPVNIDLINKAEHEIKQNGIHKVWCNNPTNLRGAFKQYSDDFKEWDSDAQIHPNNCIAWHDPSVWNVGLYKNLLKENKKPEDCEGVIMYHYYSYKDKKKKYPYRVLISNNGIYTHTDCMRNHSGGFNEKFLHQQSPNEDDIPIFKDAWEKLKKWKYFDLST